MFLNDETLATKISVRQELIRLQSSENSKEQKQATDVKKAKPAKTLMTASTLAVSASVTTSHLCEKSAP